MGVFDKFIDERAEWFQRYAEHRLRLEEKRMGNASMKVPLTEKEYKALKNWDDRYIRDKLVNGFGKNGTGFPSLKGFNYTGSEPFEDEKYGYAVEVSVYLSSDKAYNLPPYVNDHLDDITEYPPGICYTCPIAANENLEDDDSPCRDCEAEEGEEE